MTLKEAHERFRVQGIENDGFDRAFSGQEEAFKNCVALLEGVGKTKNIQYKHYSYVLKHVVERLFRPCYVSEGTLILAALSLGFAIRHCDNTTAGCHFNLSSRAFDKKLRQLQEMRKDANRN